jgi:hypothetical protein
MTVRIGHASIDERGNASGGVAGDQTGKELCIRSWYSKGWLVLLRAKDPAVRKRIAESCIAACNNENLGYDQGGRNTGLQAAKNVDWDFSKITAKAEFDCSSLVSACVQAAGVSVWDGGNAPTTRTLESVLTTTGSFEALRAAKYLSGTDYLLEGDILLKPGFHVVIVLDNGANATAAGAAYAKKPEIVPIYYSVRLPMLVKGMSGKSIKALQHLLLSNDYDLPKYGADGDFGSETENALLLFQKDHGLNADAKCGQATWSALLGIGSVG